LVPIPNAIALPVRELKIMDRTDEVPAREPMNWKLILSECKQALARFQNYDAWKRDLPMAATEICSDGLLPRSGILPSLMRRCWACCKH
jgi:hypothetical protein